MSGSCTSVEVGGKPADVFQPGGPVRFAVIHLHDLDGVRLPEQSAYTPLLDELGLACLCPHGGPCWWTDRICPEYDPLITAEHYLVHTALPYAASRWRLGPRSVGVQGIGMGGQGALRLAFKHAALFPVVAAVSPTLEYHELYGHGTALDTMYDSREQCRQDTALMHVPPINYPPHIFFCCDPSNSTWYRGNDRLHEKLTALGIAHEADLTTRVGGHSGAYFERMADRAERFIVRGLEQESRRLL